MTSTLRTFALTPALLIAAAAPAAAAGTASLRGSPASMERQHEVAEGLEYGFLRTPAEVRDLHQEGVLVAVPGNDDYRLASVSYPFARPEVRLFIERLAAQYRSGCGEAMVVTSLTRPLSTQPRNAHPLSVHPAGMAVDLRVPRVAACREWLESTLLALEGSDVLDVTRERSPAHYHVALFPAAYLSYVARREVAEQVAVATARPPEPTVRERAAEALAEGWDADGLARFTLVVALAVALLFTLARHDGRHRDVGV